MAAVTIVGRGDDWIECPFITEELWGTVSCLLTPRLGDKPFTKLFAFDSIEENGVVINGTPETNYSLIRAVKFAKELKIPIVSDYPYKDEVFPTRDIVRTFCWSLMMNSVSRMLAYAIYLECSPIWIFGIGGRSRPDYDLAKSSLMTWHGIALGRKLEVRMGRGASNWLYGRPRTMAVPCAEQRNWHEEREELCLPSK